MPYVANYFNQFSIADSATINDGQLTALFASFGAANTSEPQVLQKKLWWYNGSIPIYWSLPRVVNDSEVPTELMLVTLIRQQFPWNHGHAFPPRKRLAPFRFQYSLSVEPRTPTYSVPFHFSLPVMTWYPTTLTMKQKTVGTTSFWKRTARIQQIAKR